jgi:hypothetical protein
MGANSFKPGQIWLDTSGSPIQAHGGGMLYHQGTYYWFGENKDGRTGPGALADLHRVDVIGINCYSSQDLYNWKFEGIALPAEPNDPAGDLHPSKVVERPKVIYNARTGRFVMWLHIDTADYAYARAGVAVSDSPTGPYRYLGSFHPHGAMSRDMTIFQDEDGTAYQMFASDGNRTMRVSALSDDYLRPSGAPARIFANRFREAPALFKRHGRYYVITSGCTGWDPNAAECATARHVLGPWRSLGNPCRGLGAVRTFGAQGTYVLPVAGQPDRYIFMADIWNKHNLSDSRYAWLPIRFDGERPVIEWQDEWNLETP